MADDSEKLERFINAVNADADERAEDISIEAEQEKFRILGEADQTAREAAEKYAAEHSARGHGLLGEVSTAELEMKKTVLRRREELIDSVFAAAARRLTEFRGKKEYPAHLAKAAASAVTDGAVISLSPADMKYEKTIRGALGGKEVTFREDKSIQLGGLSVFRPDTHTAADLTFDTALEEQRSAFSAKDPFGLNG